ncbi:hypothetical protein [Paenibacillus sp. HB172176]|nr:hypothetical protein [Paenibacillus sp. HB172176]
MGRHKQKSAEARNVAYKANSKQAENHLAESTSENKNQKGYSPNSPSTG